MSPVNTCTLSLQLTISVVFKPMLRFLLFNALGFASDPLDRSGGSSGRASPVSLPDDDSVEDHPLSIDLGSLAISTTELYKESLYAKIGVDVSRKLRSQFVEDRLNLDYEPQMDNHLYQPTPLENMSLTTVVYKGHQSVVFGVAERPDLLIKYEVQCTDFDIEVHPILRDGWYMKEASEGGLAPKVLFISPPSFLCEEKKGKCEYFRMSRASFSRCKTDNGIVRYLIMKRVDGITLEALRTYPRYGRRNGAMHLYNAAQLTRELVRYLQVLHKEMKIVHGDIHTSNVMFAQSPSSTRLYLVDFGRAFRLRTDLPEIPKVQRMEWNQIMNTQWQIDGYEWAARDDLNKAIQLFAHLMNSREYHTLERQIEQQGIPAIRVWKERSDWFITDDYDPVEALGASVSLSAKKEIKQAFRRILRTVRNLPINGPLPYASIIEDLTICCYLSNNITTTLAPTIA